MAIVRRRGDDIPLLIGITNSSGVAINITNLAQLYVYIIYSTKGTTLVKFNKGGTDGFSALTAVTATSYRADIKSSITKTATLGTYHVELNVVETDTDYDSSQKNTIGLDVVFNLKDSISKTVSSG